jgi:hypothetical protein
MRGPCTVDAYLTVLTSKLTQYDVRESAREAKRGRPNIYRLGLLLQAQQRAEADVAGVRGRHDPEAMGELKRALGKHFTPDFSPVRAVLKQVGSGKCSLVTGRRRG